MSEILKYRRAFLRISALLGVILSTPKSVKRALAVQTGLTATTKYNLNLRGGPGTGYTILGLVPRQTILPVIEQIGGGTSAHWLKVNYQGTIGWIAGWYCIIEQAQAAPPPTAEPSLTSPVPKPAGRPPMVSRAEWGARLVAPEAYTHHTPTHITIHHDGALLGDQRDPLERVRFLQQWAIDTRGWEDMPYHFMIDRQGVIYEGRPVDTVGDTNTGYDPTGHVSITLLGNYQVQPVYMVMADAVADVAAWLASTYNIPLANIAGHRTYAYTYCPGEIFYLDWLQNGKLLQKIHERLSSQ